MQDWEDEAEGLGQGRGTVSDPLWGRTQQAERDPSRPHPRCSPSRAHP